MREPVTRKIDQVDTVGACERRDYLRPPRQRIAQTVDQQERSRPLGAAHCIAYAACRCARPTDARSALGQRPHRRQAEPLQHYRSAGARSGHGMAGVWGTLSCGLFTSPRLSSLNGIGHPGLVYSGSFHQLGAQALGVAAAFAAVFTISYVVFFLIKATYGLRVKPE